MRCFRKFLVAKNLWIRRGEYQKFASKIFCLTVPKNFVGEPFSLSSNSGFDIIFASNMLRVKSRFSVEIFLPHSTETVRRGTFLCCV